MDGNAITIIILAVAGVASVLLFAIKGISDQLPDLFESFRRTRGEALLFARGRMTGFAGGIPAG
ncbi:hypothetical protein ACWELO_14960 [Streptomyces sp. NPDC004596]